MSATENETVIFSLDPGPRSLGYWLVRFDGRYETREIGILDCDYDWEKLTDFLRPRLLEATHVIIEQQVQGATNNIRIEQHVIAICSWIGKPYHLLSPNTRKTHPKLDPNADFKDDCVRVATEVIDSVGLEMLQRETAKGKSAKERKKRRSDMSDTVVQADYVRKLIWLLY